MEKLNEHCRIINIKIERLPKLRCLQNILELNCIDTSILENSFKKDKILYVQINLDAYLDKELQEVFGKTAVYTKIYITPKYKLLTEETLMDIKTFNSIIMNSKIHYGEINDN